jgi:hypothetical protein
MAITLSVTTSNQRGPWETLQDGGPPDLWQLDSNEAQLFQLFPFSRVDLKKVSQFYNDEDNDNEFFDVGNHNHQDSHWVSRLIPIPMGWAALFIDYPPLGVAFCHVMDLINSIAADKANNFRILAWQGACACFRTGGIEPCSAMALDWSRLARSKANLELSLRAWQEAEVEGNHGTTLGTWKDLPDQVDDFWSLFGGGKRPKLNLGQWAPPIGMNTRGEETNTGWAPSLVPPPSAHTSSQVADLASMLATMVQAQMDGQIAVVAANTANLVAFTTATAQALATSTSNEKMSKFTPAQKSVLQASTGESHPATFVLPPVFALMVTDGCTVDALGLTLRCLLQPGGLNVRHNPSADADGQDFQLLRICDKSFSGSSRGITIFAVPWRSHESCYQQSTHKTVADVWKHTAGTKVDIPSDLLNCWGCCLGTAVLTWSRSWQYETGSSCMSTTWR